MDILACRSEVGQLVEVLVKEGPVASVLDLGGGIARELGPLAGYQVAAAGLGNPLPEREFDAVIMPFPVLGLQITDEAFGAALDTVHQALRAGGLFLFDILDGTAVLRRAPRGEFTPDRDGGTRLVRSVRASVDTAEATYRVEVQRWRLSDDRVLDHVQESHTIRFFLPRELELLLERGGFRLLDSTTTGEWSRLASSRRI